MRVGLDGELAEHHLELVARRRSLYDHEQRMVFGANTFREFLEMLGPNPEPVGEDDSIVRMRASEFPEDG